MNMRAAERVVTGFSVARWALVVFYLAWGGLMAWYIEEATTWARVWEVVAVLCGVILAGAAWLFCGWAQYMLSSNIEMHRDALARMEMGHLLGLRYDTEITDLTAPTTTSGGTTTYAGSPKVTGF